MVDPFFANSSLFVIGLRKKHGFPGGSMQKKKLENSREVTVNLTGNPGRSTLKKSIFSAGGRYNFFFWKSPLDVDLHKINIGNRGQHWDLITCRQ